VTFSTLLLGDEQLIFYDEWDEPCLIASSPRGVEILQLIQAELARSGTTPHPSAFG